VPDVYCYHYINRVGTMNIIDLNYGKQLPVIFVEGYIGTFRKAEGSGITPLAIYRSGKVAYTRRKDAEAMVGTS
jgi:hypothetical protein